MPRHELSLRVDAPADSPGAALASEQSGRLRERIYGALRLKVFSVSWVTLPMGTPKADEAIDFLVKECRAQTAVIGSAHLAEKLDEDEEPQSDWSLLSTPQASGSFSLWDDYPEYKPGGLPRVHALNHTFVSEQFVSACERAGLRGLEFLRCRNAGRKAGPPWFVALPKHSLGNGLDHPWFDRARWVRHVKDDAAKRTGAIETGQNQFHQFWLRAAEVEANAFVQRLLELCPMRSAPESGLYGLNFVTVPRYLARAEPKEDFAYLPWGEDGPNRLGKILRHRLLAVRRRARDALIAAGRCKPRDFRRVRSVASPEPGVLDLDERYEAVRPMYSAEELAALRAQERELLEPTPRRR